jgi:hypothetical protein
MFPHSIIAAEESGRDGQAAARPLACGGREKTNEPKGESPFVQRSLCRSDRPSKRNVRTFLFHYWNFYSIFVGSGQGPFQGLGMGTWSQRTA